jgi:glycosyltransferase involved in cell wall biosynthesis
MSTALRPEAFRPCCVIPIYEHGATIRALVASLAAHGLPIYIVDDGSGEATQAELARVGDAFPQVRLARLPQNRGKGAAVMHGMLQARNDGMTHALQIDADGQHDPRDVPRFIARAGERPDAVICGQALFDRSVPKARFYGRYLTHFMVWIETLSFAIRDSMCGFRLYPLAATGALIEQGVIPPRMDFDTSMVVRLAWRGVPIENLPTRVIYPAGGISHFRMLRDNVRLTRMHTLLVCGMLVRLPVLLWRKLRRTNPAPVAQAAPHDP